MATILDKFSMHGKTALVTGGAGLLGKQFCSALAQAGAKVVAADLNAAAVQAAVKSLHDEGCQAAGVSVDVTSPKSVKNMVSTTLDTFGTLDVLVCSAAMDPKFDSEHAGQHRNTFEDYPLEAWKQALDVNLTGMFLSAQAAVKPMLDQDHGVIINICSTYGLVGPDQRIYERPGQPQQYKPVFYSVTKAGVLGLTRYLSTYYAGKKYPCQRADPWRGV